MPPFRHTASGSYYELPYQWQVSSDGGTTWTDVPGGSGDTLAAQKTASLTLPAVTVEQDGWQYRCVLTHRWDGEENPTASEAAVLTVVGAPSITAQPSDYTCHAGRDAQFTVTAEGNQTLSYQWQVSTDKSQTWTDLPGANSAACTLTQAYLSLEELRYGEDLRIIHDIQAENFSIPPLTIEPLVENAVEHGVSDLPDGGSVTLTSMAMQASSTAAGIRSRRTTE